MVTTGEDMSGRVDGFTGGLKRAFRKLLSVGLSDGSVRRSVDPEINAELLFALMESVAFNILLNLEKDSRNAKSRFKAAIAAISPGPYISVQISVSEGGEYTGPTAVVRTLPAIEYTHLFSNVS